MEVLGSYEGEINLKATELTLGLPGTVGKRCNERPASEDDGLPPAKAQIAGWPPVRSFRKNALKAKKSEAAGAGIYVKVSMDGAPFLRKIDLEVYSGYAELLKALEAMFKFNDGKYSEREGCWGSDYKPTYEDKDGDWMLVGDVPWEMFMSSCKRLRIMRRADASGLGSEE